jgi:hypothetical protein
MGLDVSGIPGLGSSMAVVFIKPITIRLLAYGQKANVAAIRNRAAAMLKEEHGAVPADAFVDMPAEKVHAEIVARRSDGDPVLKKPTPSQAGLVVTLAEVNERMANEWLSELPVAKTCVVFATWTGSREPMAWQMLLADGDRSTDSTPL